MQKMCIRDRSKISYMAPAFKQQALVHILDGTIAADGEFRDAMMELENPLPEDSKLLLLIGTLQEKVTQITQEKILETVVQLLQKAVGDKISYIHKVMYRKSFVWLLESEDKELPALLFVSALDIQKMIQLRLEMCIRDR